MKEYDPRNWFWIVNGNPTQAFSSATGNYVPLTGAVYQAWIADGTRPTSIASEQALGVVLSQYPDLPRPVPAAVLDGYQQGNADDIFGRALSRLLFQMINEIRALNGQPALTPAQARSYVKGLM